MAAEGPTPRASRRVTVEVPSGEQRLGVVRRGAGGVEVNPPVIGQAEAVHAWVVAAQAHGREAHGLVPTLQQVLAVATPVTEGDDSEED